MLGLWLLQRELAGTADSQAHSGMCSLAVRFEWWGSRHPERLLRASFEKVRQPILERIAACRSLNTTYDGTTVFW